MRATTNRGGGTPPDPAQAPRPQQDFRGEAAEDQAWPHTPPTHSPPTAHSLPTHRPPTGLTHRAHSPPTGPTHRAHSPSTAHPPPLTGPTHSPLTGPSTGPQPTHRAHLAEFLGEGVFQWGRRLRPLTTLAALVPAAQSLPGHLLQGSAAPCQVSPGLEPPPSSLWEKADLSPCSNHTWESNRRGPFHTKGCPRCLWVRSQGSLCARAAGAPLTVTQVLREPTPGAAGRPGGCGAVPQAGARSGPGMTQALSGSSQLPNAQGPGR